MRTIALLWATTVAWLFVIPSLISERGTVAIGPETCAFGALAAIIVVAVPRLHRLGVRWALLLLLPLFLGVRFLIGEAVGEVPLREFLGLAYVGGAVVLATGLGRRMVSFEEVLEGLAAGPDDERADSFEEGQQDIYREIRRARRYERPVALMALSASGADASAVRSLVDEVQQKITEEYAAVQVAKLLLHETDGAAVVTRRRDHFVVLLPETESDGARRVTQRLAAAAAERWGLELRCGIATFPDQEVTFEGLLERAEADLRTEQRTPSTACARERGGRGGGSASPRRRKSANAARLLPKRRSTGEPRPNGDGERGNRPLISPPVSSTGSPGLHASNRAEADLRRVKVAYVLSRFPKLTETFVLYEMLALEREGIEVEVYPLFRERSTVMHAEAAGMVERAHFEPFLSWRIACAHAYFLRRRPGAYLGALWCLLRNTFGSLRYFAGALAIFPKVVYFARRMEEEGVSHVHAHFASHPAAAAFVIRRLINIPFSFTAHGSDLHRDRHMLREKVAEAAFVVCISRYNREVVVAECGFELAAKPVVIHCGVDLDLFRPPKNGEGNGGAGPLHIVCTGTLHEVKGQAHLIEACRLLKERQVDFHCDLIGGGPDRGRLARQANASGLGSHIRFRGECTREVVARLLREADVFVAPSVPTRDGRREGIPVALMEAAASGKPVVASALSGIPEAIEDGREGCLVPPGDSVALADAIERLAADPALRRRIGAAARERMTREFSLYANARLLAGRFRSEVEA